MSTEARTPGVSEASIALNAWAPALMCQLRVRHLASTASLLCDLSLSLSVSELLAGHDGERRGLPHAKANLLVEPDRPCVSAQDVQEYAF
jgi:hypothetical protein